MTKLKNLAGDMELMLAKLQSASVGLKLKLVLLSMLCFMLIQGAIALFFLTYTDYSYNNIIELKQQPIILLNEINDNYREMLEVADQSAQGFVSRTTAEQEFIVLDDEISSYWGHLADLERENGELLITEELKQKKFMADKAKLDYEKLLLGHDAEAIKNFIHDEMSHSFYPFIHDSADFAKQMQSSMEKDNENSHSLYFYELIISIAFIIIACIFALCAIRFARRDVVSPLYHLSKYALDESYIHDHEARMGLSRNDEIGEIANAIKRSHEKAKAALISQQKIQEAQMRLQQEQIAHEQERSESADQLKAVFNEFETEILILSEELNNAASTMIETASSMKQDASATKEHSQYAAEQTKKTAHNMTVVHDYGNDLIARASEVSRLIMASHQHIEEAHDSSRSSRQIADNLNVVMSEIASIVGMISDITRQTNLLALNATMEAARAGSYGKGFAVVAKEVKELADQTSLAAQSVESRIDTIGNMVSEVYNGIVSVDGYIDNLSESSSLIDDAVNAQNNASNEILDVIALEQQGADKAVENLNILLNKAEKADSTADRLHDVAANIAEQTNRLKNNMEHLQSLTQGGRAA